MGIDKKPEYCLQQLAKRYPQLLLPIQAGIKDTPEYKNAVLRGRLVPGELLFVGSDMDSLTTEDTPAGRVEILYLSEREDFEHALRALAYRCEPVEILPSVGASTIRGLINWEKIHAHETAYRAAGGTDWNVELKRFTADKTNYLDTIILLSSGGYSNVSADKVGLSEKEWKEKSLTIRKFHELTHFVCRAKYPEDIDPIRDEVIADCIGLIAAFKEYDTKLAKVFFGIEGETFREGGRLSHYTSIEQIEAESAKVKEWIGKCSDRICEENKQNVFELLTLLMEK